MDAPLVGPQLKFKLVRAVFSFHYLFGRQESCCFKRAEHLEWDHEVWVRRRTPPVTPLCGSHHSFLVLAPVFIHPPPPQPHLFFSITLCKLSLHRHCLGLLSLSGSNVSEPSSLIWAEPTARDENILIPPFIFFWPTDLPLLPPVRHCALNASEACKAAAPGSEKMLHLDLFPRAIFL